MEETANDICDNLADVDRGISRLGKSALPGSGDAMAGSDTADFRTPLPSKADLRSRQAWAQHITDSGFGSAKMGAFSDSSSSVGSSIRLSPESDVPAHGRRVTLGNCHFSPVTRESFSVIRSRKLDFNTTDPLPLPSRLEFVEDDDVTTQECPSELSERMKNGGGGGDEDMSVEGTAASLSPVSPGLFCFDRESLLRRIARVSHEDLEASLQEMSLEESVSSSSSSFSSFSSRSHSASVSPPPHQTPSSSPELGESESLSAMSCSSVETQEAEVKLQETGHGTLPLTTCNSEPVKAGLSGVKNTSCKDNFMTALHLTSVPTRPHHIGSLSLPVVLPLPLESQAQVCPSTLDSLTQGPSPLLTVSPLEPTDSTATDITVTTPTGTLTFQVGQPLLKSPCKRTGSSEVESDHLFSPTKPRKTACCLQITASQRASRNIFKDSGKVCGRDVHTETLDRSQEFVSLHTNLTSACQTTKSQVMSSPNVPTSAQNNLPKNFQRVLERMSPPEPSRLIGRNIGVQKLDILERLSQHFSLCVAKILHCLNVEDLMRVSMVSRVWRRALEGDSVSYTRYRCHLWEAAKKRATLTSYGKENGVAKLTDDSAVTPMTASKGCLASVQRQADVKTPLPPHQQPKTPQASAATPLLYEDKLRHCPRCQHPALVRPHQGRAACMDPACGYDFCTQCFAAFHHPRPCKPLNRSVSKGDVAGSHKSKKSLKRL